VSEQEKKTNKAERNGERHRFPFNFIIHLDFIADVERVGQKGGGGMSGINGKFTDGK
jgi:hypothetical protein